VGRVGKSWHLLPHDAAAIDRLARAVDASPVVAQLLLNRGIGDSTEAKRFLECPLMGLRPPAELPGAVAACELLTEAARARRRITVYGDYDVDGVTGTAILLRALQLIGADVDYYLPNRLEEGYGLNSEALRRMAATGSKVIVTVDCGIGSCAEAEVARELGLDLVVTDHHEFAESLPEAQVVVHPRLPGGTSTFAGISGSGVAFKIAWLLCQKASGSERVEPRMREFLLDAVGMAALGLIADVVPLLDENRIYVRHGLQRIGRAPTPGIRALLEAAGLAADQSLRAEDIAFRVAPRLNAAGRLGCARLVVDLLTTASAERARPLAQFLEEQNQKRQKLERQLVAEARAIVDADALVGAALVVDGDGWHPGVIGIVAGRLCEYYGRPALVISRNGDSAVGSGRSAGGFALHEALAACGELLLSHGGHAAAAGFRIECDQIDEFRRRFVSLTSQRFPDGPPPPCLTLDAELPLSALTPGLVAQIDRLEPFGAENPAARFLAAGLQIVGQPRTMGGGERHLNFQVRQGSCQLRAVAWNFADRSEDLLADQGRCCLAFTPRINEWNGQRKVELNVIDFQAGPCAQLL
jgi:single-stranded-DNA-specific exonuclease